MSEPIKNEWPLGQWKNWPKFEKCLPFVGNIHVAEILTVLPTCFTNSATLFFHYLSYCKIGIIETTKCKEPWKLVILLAVTRQKSSFC